MSALARWPFSGVPDTPGAWLMTAARNRARNHLRDVSRASARLHAAAVLTRDAEAEEEAAAEPTNGSGAGPMADDRLRLVFVCCHPLLPIEAQAALTLRMVAGLSTRQVARGFLQPEATVAQRIVRAKRTLTEAGVAFSVPDRDEWPGRLPGVLRVVYLVFNEGHTAAEGPDLTRPDLCEEAIRLGRLLAQLLPGGGEILGLLALMSYQASRLATRTDGEGNVVLLADQDRSRWDPAPSWEETDWPSIVGLYDALASVDASPVVRLNRAVALAMARGPEEGMAAVHELVASQALDGYHLLWATRADLLRRLGRQGEAAVDYERALALVTNDAESRYLAARRAECLPHDEQSDTHAGERG